MKGFFTPVPLFAPMNVLGEVATPVSMSFRHYGNVLSGVIISALVGAAWAMINVNSYPMVVELAKGADVGKYTGFYYTFSMAAQIITPILSGFLLENAGYHTLFPYGAVCVAVSFFTMLFVRHGDAKTEKLSSKLEAFASPDD